MASVLNPYINFRGTAAEAMTFYQGVFGGELVLTTFGDFGVTDYPGAEAQIMHSKLESPSGFVLMASDTPEPRELTFGTNVSVSLGGDDTDELTGYWEKLVEGATVLAPLTKAPWGDSFGMLTDRFGVQWLVNIAGAA